MEIKLDSTGLYKGARLKIINGTGKNQILVIKSVIKNTITTRKYYFFDRWFDAFSKWWLGLKYSFLEWWYEQTS